MKIKLEIKNIGYEDFGGNQDFLDISFCIGNDEMYHAYLDADGEIDKDNFDVGGWDADTIADELTAMLEDRQEEISQLISDSVFGSNNFVSDKQLFGTWLNSWGVFKFVGSDGECGVAVCHANDATLRIDRKAKTFPSEDEYLAWHDEMMQDDNYGDASIVKRAIDDIEGEDY